MDISVTSIGQVAVGSIILFVPLLAWMARNRGLSATAWGMVGLLFPFNAIASLLLLFAPANTRRVSEPVREWNGSAFRVGAAFVLATLSVGAAIYALAVLVQPDRAPFESLMIKSVIIFVPILGWMTFKRGISPLGGIAIGLLFPLNAIAFLLLLFVPLKDRTQSVLSAQVP
ncbi:MAG: hypothetical protein AAF270_16320 [Pseudomonadota bacterium]